MYKQLNIKIDFKGEESGQTASPFRFRFVFRAWLVAVSEYLARSKAAASSLLDCRERRRTCQKSSVS